MQKEPSPFIASMLASKQTANPPAKGPHIHNCGDNIIIKDVWEDNFDVEFRKIMKLAEHYKYIGMDTEFPGIVYRIDDSEVHFAESLEYKVIKKNVDQLKCIQVGISFANEEGFIPPGVCTWQFNLQFDKNVDDCSQESIDLLTSSGIQFDKHSTNGVDPQLFGEYLISSGLLLNEDITWVCFHGGFDFAYLVKLLNYGPLPNDDAGFYKLLNAYFPSYYDMKYLIRDLEKIKVGGLSKLASDLNVRRFGPQHQAGSDSLLTLSTFLKLKEVYFKTSIDPRYANVIFGIGNSHESASEYHSNYINYTDPQMMYAGYTMGMSNNIMNSYYGQQDNIYSSINPTNNYNYSYNVMYNYPQNQFMESHVRNKSFSGKDQIRK